MVYRYIFPKYGHRIQRVQNNVMTNWGCLTAFLDSDGLSTINASFVLTNI